MHYYGKNDDSIADRLSVLYVSVCCCWFVSFCFVFLVWGRGCF